MGELDDPVVVDFPLRGEWSVERTPAHRIPSHGTDFFGQRFAYDFVRTDGRAGLHVHPAGTLRWHLIGGRTEDCYGWGESVHAALDGEIIAAVDGVPERKWIHPVRETLVGLSNGLRLARGRLHPTRLAGNYVIIRTANVYALYAHLAPGSVAVKTGKVVGAGEVIGRLGHTGNSTAPHLHLQLMDAANPIHANGIACAFSDYLVQGDAGWERVERGIPQRQQRTRSSA